VYLVYSYIVYWRSKGRTEKDDMLVWDLLPMPIPAVSNILSGELDLIIWRGCTLIKYMWVLERARTDGHMK
jgi:hypothetical protein